MELELEAKPLAQKENRQSLSWLSFVLFCLIFFFFFDKTKNSNPKNRGVYQTRRVCPVQTHTWCANVGLSQWKQTRKANELPDLPKPSIPLKINRSVEVLLDKNSFMARKLFIATHCLWLRRSTNNNTKVHNKKILKLRMFLFLQLYKFKIGNKRIDLWAHKPKWFISQNI